MSGTWESMHVWNMGKCSDRLALIPGWVKVALQLFFMEKAVQVTFITIALLTLVS